MHLRAVLGLVKAQVQPAAQVVARLRDAACDAVGDGLGNRVGGAGVVSGGFFEECCNIAEGCKAHAQHIRVSGGEDHLVEAVAIEAVFQTNLGGIGRAGEGVVCVAFRPRPVGGGNHALVRHFAVLALAAA